MKVTSLRGTGRTPSRRSHTVARSLPYVISTTKPAMNSVQFWIELSVICNENVVCCFLPQDCISSVVSQPFERGAVQMHAWQWWIFCLATVLLLFVDLINHHVLYFVDCNPHSLVRGVVRWNDRSLKPASSMLLATGKCWLCTVVPLVVDQNCPFQ
jgi:hypothetical protein